MVTSPSSSPPQKWSNNSQGGGVGAGSGQLLQELEALSQALYQAQNKSISSQSYPSQPPPHPQPPSQPQAPPVKKLSFLSRREALSGRRISHDTSKDVSSKEPIPFSSVPAHDPPPSFANLLSRHSLSSAQASPSLEQQKPSPANMHPRYSNSVVSSQNPSAWGDEQTDIRSRMNRRLSLQPLPARNSDKSTPQESADWPEDPLESSRRFDATSSDKKKSVWSSWKPLRALSHIGRQRLHCVFSAYVHAIEGLPPAMNGLRLCVHMRKEETKEGAVQTMPSRVFQGIAEFQETLFMKCTLYGNKGPSNTMKFMAKAFIVSVIAPDIDELDFGKHQLDLSRLLGDFMDDNKGQLEKGNSWDTTLDLTGKAKGGRLAITFNYEILDKDSAFSGNVSSRFRESPPHRSSMHSSYSLPNSAHGTPRTITTRAHLSHSPSASEPGNDYDDLLAMDQLNLDEPHPLPSGSFEARGGPAGGQIAEVHGFPAFRSQPDRPPTASQSSFNAFPSIEQKPMSLLQTDTIPAPSMPSQSMVIESTPRLPEFIKEEDGPLSEDEADFVVVDRGMEIDDSIEKHSDVIVDKEMNGAEEETSDDLVPQVVEMDTMDDLPEVIDVEALDDLSPKAEMDGLDDLSPHVVEMESLDDPTPQVDEMEALDDLHPQQGLDDPNSQLLGKPEVQALRGHEDDDERSIRKVFDGEPQQAEAFSANESTVDEEEVQENVEKLSTVDEGERKDNVTYLTVMQTLDSLLRGTSAKEIPQEEENVEVESSVDGVFSDEEDTAHKEVLNEFSSSSQEIDSKKSVMGLSNDNHDSSNNLEDESDYEDAEDHECSSNDDKVTEMSNMDVESCKVFVEKGGGSVFSEEREKGSKGFEEEETSAHIFEEDQTGAHVFEEDQTGAHVFEEGERGSKDPEEDETEVQVLEEEERGSKDFELDKTEAHVLEEEKTVAPGFEDEETNKNDFEEEERGIAIFEEEGEGNNALEEEKSDKSDFEEKVRGIASFEEEGIGNHALEEEKRGSHIFDEEEEDNITLEDLEEQESDINVSQKQEKGDFHTEDEERGSEVTDEERGTNVVRDEERCSNVSTEEGKGSCAVLEEKKDSNITTEEENVFVKEQTANKNLGSEFNFYDEGVFNYVEEDERGKKGTNVDTDILKERTYREADRISDEDTDSEVDLVAGEFLDMLGMANTPETKDYDSEVDSPRARLLKQFEEEAFLEGGFGLDLEVPEFSLDGPLNDEEAGGPAVLPFHKSAVQGMDKEPANRDHTSVLMGRDTEPMEWHHTSLFNMMDKEPTKWESASEGIEKEPTKLEQKLASEIGKEPANWDYNLAFKGIDKEPAIRDHTLALKGHEKEPVKWNNVTDLKVMDKGPAKWEYNIDLKGMDKEPAYLDRISALKRMDRDPGNWELTSAFKGIGLKSMDTEQANWENTLALKELDKEFVSRDHILHLKGMEKEPAMNPSDWEHTLALNGMHKEPANRDRVLVLERRDSVPSHWGTEKADKEPVTRCPDLPPKAAEKEPVNLDIEDDEDLMSFVEAAESELHRSNQSMQSKTRAKMLEDAETEALMQEWGLNEKAFVTSPPKPTMRQQEPPPLGKGLGAAVPLKDGGSLRSMNPSHFQANKSNGKLVMQISKPIVVPAEMGSETVDILRNMASMGVENMAVQAMTAMPLEDITGRSVEQVASEGKMTPKPGHRLLEGSTGSRKELSRNDRKSRPSAQNIADDIVSLEDIAPMAMQQIEALAMDGLKVQSDVAEDEAPFTLNAFSLDSEPGGMDLSAGSAIVKGITGVHLSKGARSSTETSLDGGNGPMGMAISLDEWMLLDAGLYDEMETTKDSMAIMAAHHASHQELVVGSGGDDDKRKKKQGPTGARWGCMGNTLTIAMLVQLRDPLKNNEAVGAPMMAFVQAERMMKPPKMKVGRNVSMKGNSEDEEAGSGSEEPQFKITGVHMAGLKDSQEEKKVGWGNQKQLQSGSRWLIANGMSKNSKGQARPMLPSKPSVTAPASSAKANNASKGESLWSLSTRALSSGFKWKDKLKLNSHVRNPDVLVQTK